MRLLNKTDGKIYNVDDGLVNQALASGNYEIQPGVKIPVISSSGKRGTIPSESIDQALRSGWRYRTEQEDRDYYEQQTEDIYEEEYGGRDIMAGALGFLRGRSLGLSDAAIAGTEKVLTSLGVESAEGAAEAAEKIRKYNPTVSTGAEIAGAVSSVLGPDALIARGATALGLAGKTTQAIGTAYRATGAPMKALTKGATAVPKVLAGTKGGQAILSAGSNLSPKLTSTLAKLGAAGTVGAIEGAGVGVGETITDLAFNEELLEDPEKVAELAISNIGLGAAFGGAGGSLLRAATLGGGAGLDFVSKKLKEIDLSKPTESNIASALTKIYGTANWAARGFTNEPIAKKIFAREGRALRQKLETMRNDSNTAYREIEKRLDVVRQFADELEGVANQGANVASDLIESKAGQLDDYALWVFANMDPSLKVSKELVNEVLEQNPASAGAKAYAARLSNAKNTVQGYAKGLNDKAKEMLAKNREYNNVYEGKAINVAEGVSKKLADDVAAATNLSEINNAIVNAKNTLAQGARLFGKGRSAKVLKATNQTISLDTIDELKPFWKQLKELSVDSNIFGELGSAAARRADNLSILKESAQKIDKTFFDYVQKGGTEVRLPDYAKLESYFRNSKLPRNAKRKYLMKEYEENIRKVLGNKIEVSVGDLGKEIKRLELLKKDFLKKPKILNQALTPEQKNRAAKAIDVKIRDIKDRMEAVSMFNNKANFITRQARAKYQSFDDIVKEVEELREAVQFLNRAQSWTGRSLLGPGVGLATGYLASGIAGSEYQTEATMIMGIIGAIFTNPGTSLRFLTAMENASSGMSKMARNAAIKLKKLDKAPRDTGVKILERGARAGLIRSVIESDEQRKRNYEYIQKQYDDALENLNKYSDPSVLWDSMFGDLSEDQLESNPVANMTAYNTVLTGIQFLQDKMPKDPNPMMFGVREFKPSQTEMRRFMEYYTAVTKPKTLLKQIESGDIKTRTVEAVAAVYPNLYEEIQTAMIEEVMGDDSLSFKTKSQLGILFQVPTVQPLRLEYQRLLREIYDGQGGEEQQSPSQPKEQGAKLNPTQMVGFREMNISERQQRV